jgi:biopolymer transport protein ExbD
MTEPLSPAQRSKIRRLAAPAEPTGDEGGELNVVPYLDIITNIMMFVLVSVSVVFTSSITTAAAGTRRDGPPDEGRALRLTALITGQGVALTTAGGPLAPGCNGVGAGITVPKRGEVHDLAVLSECARRIKGARPEFAQETQVTVSANPGVPYATVIGVMDALRGDEHGELFPEVHLGVVR